MPEQEYDRSDDQAGAETFDETHIDDEGEGDLLLDEAGQVLDVTQMPGDSGSEDREMSAAESGDFDTPEADDKADDEAGNGAENGRDEVELVYSGLMRNARGAQASAAHWEARTLADDDIESLGYAPDEDDAPRPEQAR